MTKELDGSLAKVALGAVDRQTSLSQTCEELPQVVFMKGRTGASHQNVVQIDEEEREVSQHTVHQALECLSAIFEAKWHPDELE